MEKILYINGEENGIIGKSVFKDSSGNQLFVGDIAIVLGSSHLSINLVTKDCLYGWASDTRNGAFNDVIVRKIISHTELEKTLNNKRYARHIGHKVSIQDNNIKEMTIDEIEKELGYKIKIIKNEQ